MALVKFGAGVSEMRGKEGGVIYSRNAFGSYIKTKVSPVNPNSLKQQAVRSLMGNLAQLWATLTAGEQAAWETLGAQVTRINRFGDSLTYTGFSLFMRLNRNLSNLGVSAITVAPSLVTMPDLAIASLTVALTGTSMSLAFSPSTPGATFTLVVYVTPLIYTGRKFVKNFYRLVGFYANPASPKNVYAEWTAYFGTVLVPGTKVFLKAKIIENTTGWDSVPQVISAVVAA